MPRLVNSTPSYRLHKASGQAVVTLNGEDVYLGPFQSKKSRREYDRVTGEWLARGRQRPGAGAGRRVADVIIAYWRFASVYYGTPARLSRLASIKSALGLLRRTYGDTPVRDFGPLALQVVRERMVKEGWSRSYVNEQVSRIKRMFKWAAARELIPPTVPHGLETVEGLRRGEADVRDSVPVGPVDEGMIEATLPHASRQVRSMIDLQLATGMRPGETCIIRRCDIDTSGEVWVYRPEFHKGEHRGYARVIYLGPKAKAIITPFFKPELEAYLFSPREAEEERRAALTRARKTPAGYGNGVGTNRSRRPEKVPAERYTVSSYRRAIAYACDAPFPPPAELARQRVKCEKGKTRTRWETRAGALPHRTIAP